MKKSQWYYECECGFKVAHTVAKVELEEAVMQELFETGKTKKKITGFTSKAGNVFDTCLKFEDDRISFDLIIREKTWCWKMQSQLKAHRIRKTNYV